MLSDLPAIHQPALKFVKQEVNNWSYQGTVHKGCSKSNPKFWEFQKSQKLKESLRTLDKLLNLVSLPVAGDD